MKYSFTKYFGCRAYVDFDRKNRKKIDSKSNKCIFILYGVDDLGYRFLNYEKHKIIRVGM